MIIGHFFSRFFVGAMHVGVWGGIGWAYEVGGGKMAVGKEV